MSDVVNQSKQNMEKRLKAFEADLTKIRTGRASIALVDGVKVDYYGNPSPLNQVATLSTPDARTIVVAPFEKALIGEIERAIMKADLGLQPTNDGNVVRIPIPALTEDRRKDIVKNLKKTAEDAKISLRQIRKDSNDLVKTQQKNKIITEDDVKRLEKDIQKLTDDYVAKVDEKFAKKEKEIMTV
jgi:ribosome recycling factor